jgi:hypothetical protein
VRECARSVVGDQRYRDYPALLGHSASSSSPTALGPELVGAEEHAREPQATLLDTGSGCTGDDASGDVVQIHHPLGANGRRPLRRERAEETDLEIL